MAQFVLIGVSAGAAAALLFASISSGTPAALFLAQFAPLPIMISGLGWGHWAALVAAVFAALALAIYYTGFLFVVFLLGVGLPAWWLSYLALLARPDANGTGTLEWYPVGRLVIWACVIGTLVVSVGAVSLGLETGGFDAALKAIFDEFLRGQNGLPGDGPLALPGVADSDRFLDLLVLVIPPASAALSTMTNVLILWIAGRVVNVSGRLRRPWPDLAEMRLPVTGAAALVVALAGSVLPDLAGVLCRLAAASLTFAYVLLGFAVLHALTRPLRSRSFMLAAAYAAALLLQWPTLIVLAIGLADAAFNLRSRVTARGGPPRLPSS